MIRKLLFLVLIVMSISTFGQTQNIAAIVDEKTHQIDIVFISKILLMLLIGIVALLSYFKYRKTEP